VKELRCAIYARFSSDRQSPTSISDQIRKCRDYATRHGWLVLDDHIYSDEAIVATSMAREGLQRLLEAASDSERVFDCILIDDTSRLTRKLADALNLYEKLTFAGVRLVAVSQGVDSDSAQAELLARTRRKDTQGNAGTSIAWLSYRRPVLRLFIRQDPGRQCPARSESCRS